MGSPTIPNPSPVILQTALVDPNTGVINRNWFPFFYLAQAALNAPGMPVFNVLSYGATGSGSGNDSMGIKAAYDAAVAAGGGTVYLPPVPAFYSIASPLIMNSTVPVTILGSGNAGIIKRTGTMPDNVGVFDMTGSSHLTFQNLTVDGNVLTSVGVAYSQITNFDPLIPLLTKNTSFWIHDGCSYISFKTVTIQHTGGYSVLVQVNNLDVTDLSFFDFHLLNNRPNLFGINPGDTNYGSWTGGVLLHTLGTTTTATVRRCSFLSCSARRCNGTAFWTGHLYGFNTFFEGVSFEDIYAEDCARDVIQLGACVGCRINGVTARRIGYTTQTDTDKSVAKYEVNQWAVCLDMGVCFGTVISNLNFTSVNGGFCDIDGLIATTLSNFSFRTPLPGDPEYIQDGIGLIGWAGATTPGGPNGNYGILEAPAGYGPFSEGSHKVSAGNIINVSAGALRLYAAHNSAYSDIRIWHNPVNSGAPVQIGNLGSTDALRSFGNTVSNLHIEYNPTTPVPCISEVGGASPFLGSDINQYLMNQVVSSTGATAVHTDPASGSIASVTENIDFSSYAGILKVTDGSITGS